MNIEKQCLTLSWVPYRAFFRRPISEVFLVAGVLRAVVKAGREVGLKRIASEFWRKRAGVEGTDLI